MQSLPPILFLLLLLSSILVSTAQQLSPSQSKALLRLQRSLEYPQPLAGWTPYTPFCSLPPSPSLSLSCSSGRLTTLSIAGAAPRGPQLSPAFSLDSLFTTLSRFPNLTDLSLVSLGIWGPLPPKLHRLSSLRLLNLSSNHLHGPIPPEITTLPTLKNLVLSDNSLNGTVPDFRSSPVLDELDLGGNLLGPNFPSLSKSLVIAILKNNSFRGSIPSDLSSFERLQKLDLSSNRLNGKVPPFLFSLPAIRYLDLSHNQLTGALSASLSCGDGLGFVDISSNLLVGSLPTCMRTNSSGRVVLNSWNCMASGDTKYQHRNTFCNAGALAAFLPPAEKKDGSESKMGLILGILAGIVGGLAVLGVLLLVVLKRRSSGMMGGKIFEKPINGNALVKAPPRIPADTRHMSQAVRIGTLGLQAYRVFTMEELEEATNSFDPSNLIGDGPRGQFYKGWLRDCSTVVVRCMKSRQKHSPQVLLQYMDIISKLRHCHLVSILGHCIDSGHDNDNTTTIFLVYEYISNGTLRSHLTEWRKREMLKWPQRVAAVIGVARGIQFLHTVTVPGIVGNDLNIENILLNETLTAKISNYNLPELPKNKNKKICSGNPFEPVDDGNHGRIQNLEHGEKEDVHQLGLILLEVIIGKPVESQSELEKLKPQLLKGLSEDPEKLREMTDPTIRGTFAYDSLRTAMETTLGCIAKDPSKRPSIDDVLWNLQYTVQIQEGWASSENLSTQS